MKVPQFNHWVALAVAGITVGAAPTQAQDHAGNGGNALECKDPITGAVTSQMLDSHEAKKRGWSYDFSSVAPGPNELRAKVELVLFKLAVLDPFMANELSARASDLLKGIEEVAQTGKLRNRYVEFTHENLEPLNDSYEVSTPSNCQKIQLINMNRDHLPEDPMWTIQLEVWGHLDTDQQAIAVLHEAWYALTLDKGAKDSRFARYINGKVATYTVSVPNVLEYWRLIELAKEKNVALEELLLDFNPQWNEEQRSIQALTPAIRSHDLYGKLAGDFDRRAEMGSISPLKMTETKAGPYHFGLKSEVKGSDRTWKKDAVADDRKLILNSTWRIYGEPFAVVIDSQGRVLRYDAYLVGDETVYNRRQHSAQTFYRLVDHLMVGNAEIWLSPESLYPNDLKEDQYGLRFMDKYKPQAHFDAKNRMRYFEAEGIRRIRVNGKDLPRSKIKSQYVVDDAGNLVIE